MGNAATERELPAPEALILVAVVPRERDLEIARVLGWYRIPLRFAPKVIEVDYVAFYQTGAFGEGKRWRVEKFAEMRGHELVKRSDLLGDEADHPRANEEYYKLELGPLRTLKEPIQAVKWKRITFFYTLGSLFQTAGKMEDLVVRSEEREILWHALRERAEVGYRPGPGDDALAEDWLSSVDAWEALGLNFTEEEDGTAY